MDNLKEDHKEFIKSKKLILKIQQRFRSEKHNVFTEEINKIALSSNDDKRMQSIDLIETDASGTSKDLVSEKEENKCNNINKTIQKTINLDDVLKEETKEHSNWSQIPDPYIILRIRGSASGKKNLLSQQPNIGKVYLYAKDPYEAKYQFLIHNK